MILRLFSCLSVAMISIAGTCDDSDPTLSPCILEKIKEIQAQPLSNPPQAIYRQESNGLTFYYLPPPCCDFPGIILDNDCHYFCSPDGGLTGEGAKDCPAYIFEPKKSVLIWKDPRE